MAQPEFLTIEEYIEGQPAAFQDKLNETKRVIEEAAPLAKATIKWGMPTYVQNENLIHFAWNKNHLGIYPGAEAIEHFFDRFKKEGYRFSKGAVQFPWAKGIPWDFIREITRYRVEQVTK